MKELLNDLKALVAKYDESPGSAPVTKRQGFSLETTELGGRSHSLLDEVIDELRAGDQYDRAAAEGAPRYLVFDPREEAMLPDDPTKQKLIKLAVQRYWVLYWGIGQKPIVQPFAIRCPDALADAVRNDYHEYRDDHGVMLLPEGMTPEIGVRTYVGMLREGARWSRDHADDDIVPSPRQ